MARRPSPEKRAAILAAALKRFLHYGLKKTSMQEVAGDAGVGQAQTLLAGRKRADSKLVQYVKQRWAIWQEVGLRAPGALELAQAVLRLTPEKPGEFVDEFANNLAAILREGRKSGVFAGVVPERDARVLTLALSGFFPVAGREQPMQPGERELELVLDWFVKRFRRKA
jgi:hypothetical protein